MDIWEKKIAQGIFVHKKSIWAGPTSSQPKQGRRAECMSQLKLPIFMLRVAAELTFATRQAVRTINESS